MKYKSGYLPSFGEELRALLEKYKSLKKDFEALKGEVENSPEIGVSLGEGIREIRLNITSRNRGKRGGARVITHEILAEIDSEEITSIASVSIYDKPKYDAMDLDIARRMIKEYRGET